MNTKNSNLLLLLSIVITVALIWLHGVFPARSLVVVPGENLIYTINGSRLPDGKVAASWLDRATRSYRCVIPETFEQYDYYCGFYLQVTPSLTQGLDFSQYDTVNVDVDYSGPAKKIRLLMRNFDTAYSVLEDYNSLKFNAVFFDTDQLGSTVSLATSEFVVADWWLANYKIPRRHSRPDLRNVIIIGLDFVENRPPFGVHDFRVRGIRLDGEWISKEHWYLLILSFWLAGIFVYSVYQLLLLQRKTKQDSATINALNEKNDLLRNESDRFRKLSTVDSLTNTYNRFGVDQIINTLLLVNNEVRKGADASQYALVLIDIDHFKEINDTRGHDAGDRVLQRVAATIKNSTRPQDFVSRWGGEEFLIIMPSTDKKLAFSLAETIRLAVEKDEFEPADRLVVTVSIGVGARLGEEDFATAFKRIDKALYKAKDQGRNCSCMAEDR